MLFDIKITNVTYNGDGSVHLDMEWNGNRLFAAFPTQAAMLEQAMYPLQTGMDIARVILGYWRGQDSTLLDSSKIIGKMLHVNLDGDPVSITTLGPNPTLTWTRGLPI